MNERRILVAYDVGRCRRERSQDGDHADRCALGAPLHFRGPLARALEGSVSEGVVQAFARTTVIAR